MVIIMEIDRNPEELEDLLQGIKETIDNAYEVTKNKYGVETANAAIMNFFIMGI